MFFFFQVAYTSAPGEDQIVPFRDYDRKFSPHYVSIKTVESPVSDSWLDPHRSTEQGSLDNWNFILD